MGKKNIQPNSSQPVFRSLVARPALEELREENLTEGNQGHGPSITTGGPGPSTWCWLRWKREPRRMFLRRRRRVRTLAYHITQENVKNPFPLASAVCLLQQIDLLPLLLLAFRLVTWHGGKSKEVDDFFVFWDDRFSKLRVIPPKSLLPQWDFLGVFCFGLYLLQNPLYFWAHPSIV